MSKEVVRALQYVGVAEDSLELVWRKMYYWDFVISLAEGLEKYGRLTEKQEEALVTLIKTHTGVVCDKSNIITHTSKYKRKGTNPQSLKRQVRHNFGHLEVIQLFDLPFESGSVVTAEFHPYNAHSLVIELKGTYYKIPKPEKWNKLSNSAYIKFRYKRTEMKGYMTKELNEDTK